MCKIALITRIIKNKFKKCIALFSIRKVLTALYTFAQNLMVMMLIDVHLYSAVTPCFSSMLGALG